MRKIYSLFLLAALSFAAAPVFGNTIPDTTPAMSESKFWLARHAHPDQVILSSAEIEKFNRQLAAQGLTKGVFGLEDRDFNLVRNEIAKEVLKFKMGTYYNRSGQQIGPKVITQMAENIDLENFWEHLKPRYGVVTAMTNQRLLPTDEILTAEALDLEFDEVQNSSLDIGTPVHVLLATRDGQWLYVETTASPGWVKAADVALDQSRVYQLFYRPVSLVVVTAAKAELYRNPDLKDSWGRVRMGAVFSIQKEDESFFEIPIPRRAPDGSLQIATAYLKKTDVHNGFLPYTPRTIMEQAFKMYGAPYGWGGINGEQDCSSFLKQVFATVGIELPRNSGEQGQVGVALSVKRKAESALKKAVPGITLARMKGHIVLFIGMYEGRPYAIHETYAYRESVKGKDQKHVVNRVIVSSMDLGQGSKKGSLLERTIAVQEVR